ncbi:MAG: MCE family protein [Sporichthyaceae bacterium]
MKRRFAIGGLVAAVVLGTAGCGPLSEDTQTVKARFADSVGIFPGNDVDVLGVPVGRVTKVSPQGTTTLIEMKVRKNLKIPADVQALIIPPSVINDRYVELAPVWKAGPTLPAGTEIPLARTRNPVEFDRIVRALDTLATSLSSERANIGAIQDALEVGAANFAGNGAKINRGIKGLATALETFSDRREDISGIVKALDGLTASFARNDATIRKFSTNVTTATEVLADNGQALNQTVAALATALREVGAFVKENQSGLGTSLRDLTEVLAVVNRHRVTLTEALDVLPLTFQNLTKTVNPANQRLVSNASAAANVLNPVIAQQFCDGFGPFLCPTAGKPIGSISDAFGDRKSR